MSEGRWADLGPRLVSGLTLALVGIVAVRLGGDWFWTLAVLAAGLMLWELVTMLGAGSRAVLAMAAGELAVGLGRVLPDLASTAVMMAAAAVAAVLVARDRTIAFGYGLAVVVAAVGLVDFRERYGGTWLFWLILVVIASDVGGYFAGRMIGGPKFWPRVSPKKTWSGTVAGWVGAALVGLLFYLFTDAGRDLIWISAMVAFAAQMGDILESAIKRRAGVKDASNLIPGHGGLLDRFDGLLGAALMMLAVSFLVTVPGVRI